MMRGTAEVESALLRQIDRIEALFDAREQEVHAFLPEEVRFGRLRREAQSLAERYPHPESRPPLFGGLIGVKDVFRVDGFPTRAGSRLPPDLFEGPEADSVRILREAGALILGKTVSTEFAYFAPGPTRNPRSLDHTPGGSSSGSAAFCGVVGYKPSYDRISRDGVIPLSPSLDHVGVLSAHVAESTLAASLLCRDWQPAVVVRKPVLGIPEGPYLEQAEADGLAHFRRVCDSLASGGFKVEPAPAMPDFDDIQQRHGAIVAADAARVHADWFAQYGELYHAKTADLIRRGQSISERDLGHLLEGRRQLRDELTALMAAHGIDLWISPSAPGAAPRGLESTGNPVMNLPWTHSGLPTLSLPSGVDADGLPMGLQIAARWQADETLMAWGSLLEQALRD